MNWLKTIKPNIKPCNFALAQHSFQDGTMRPRYAMCRQLQGKIFTQNDDNVLISTHYSTLLM